MNPAVKRNNKTPFGDWMMNQLQRGYLFSLTVFITKFC